VVDSRRFDGSLGAAELHAHALAAPAVRGHVERPALPRISLRVLAALAVALLAAASYAAAVRSPAPLPGLAIASLAACGAGASILVWLVWALRADRRAEDAMHRLVAALLGRPTMRDWTGAISRELDDPSVRLILWDEKAHRFHEVPPLINSTADSRGRRCIPIGDRTAPVALLSIDERSGDCRELLRAVCATTSLAVGNHQVEAELRASIARLAAAGDSERRRIARDLHDCAQQRLLSLRIHLSLACDSLPRSEDRSKIEVLCDEVDQALAELRDVTHGLYPAVLSRYGVAAALRSASSRAALPVRVEDLGISRHDEAVEHAVYFCCLEALQNAAKHGGPHPSALVRLTEQDGELCFEVVDDGVGFLPHSASRGEGLVNLADRMRAVGGTLTVESAPGRGARVRGRVAVA
jgi:signal transduction histidine kinase